MRPTRKKREFKPWLRDVLAAQALMVGLVATVCAAGLLFEYGSRAVALTLGAVCLAGAVAAASLLERARSRAFGKKFEGWHTPRAIKALWVEGVRCTANVPVHGLGDVDILVHLPDAQLPVEIKSFRRWTQFLFVLGTRERRALWQAEQQRRHFNARWAIVWLPQGQSSLHNGLFGAGRGAVRVVFGDAAALVRAVQQLR
jgi:hypothetical protein